MVLDRLGEKMTKKNATVEYCKTVIHGKALLIAKPQTYMNLSGQAVSYLCHYFDIPNDNLIIIYDDIDLPMGNIRIRKSGGAGTHNGMRSVIQHLGQREFPRIRVGIQPAEKTVHDLAAYVLKPVKGKLREELQTGIVLAADAVMEIMNNNIDFVMNKYNRRLSPCSH